MKVSKNKIAMALLVAAVAVTVPAAVNAASTADSELTQEITNGALSTDVRNVSGQIVASPSFAMDTATVSTSQQSVDGVFGTNTQRISVDNPGAADSGWTLALNATTPGTGVWSDGSNDYAYNDASPANGQLTVDPSAGTVTALQGTSTGVSLAASPATFTGSGAITIATATAGSADIWNGYFTGIDLAQTIPASQPSGNYSLDVTQTVAAQ
ncbi:MAG: hypothetical protein L0H38_02450 [bacterium]|nr:hypothetical protein [bacterium]